MSSTTSTEFTRRSDELEIFTGDYLSRIRHLEAQAEALVEAAKSDGTPLTLGEEPEYVAIKKERDALYAEAQQKAFYVGVQAPKRSVWKKLIAEHPMRKGDDLAALPPDIKALEEFVGFNVDTFPEVLAPIGITHIRRGKDGEREPWSDMAEGKRVDFLDDLGEGNFATVWQRITSLYRGVAINPKLAPLDSPASPVSDEISD